MKKIKIIDTSLRKSTSFSFKEKITFVKQLANLNIDLIELPLPSDTMEEKLLIKTIAPFVGNTVVSCIAGATQATAENAWNALSSVTNARLVVAIPTSTVQMEYFYHQKPAQIIELIESQVKYCKTLCENVEFSALDATRSDMAFLSKACSIAISAGATSITLSDCEGAILQNEFADFINRLYSECAVLRDVPLNVECSDELGMGSANSMAAVLNGACGVKTSITGIGAPKLEQIVNILKSRGDSIQAGTNVKATELHSVISGMSWIDGKKSETTAISGDNIGKSSDVVLAYGATVKSVAKVVAHMGYELSATDITKVYEAFERVSRKKKTIGGKELETIIADVAQQAPATYTLSSYIINSGDCISPMAQVELEKDGEKRRGVCIGDGPIDAALLAIEQILGAHYEMDDFQIRAVTEGQEAMGEALVKLRSRGKLYSGSGISTDIIGAAIRAYLNALNKIVYDETVNT